MSTIIRQRINTTCSGCSTRVTVDRDAAMVKSVIPSNGLRGSKRVESSVAVTEILDDDDELVTWDCPACGHADSFDLFDGVSL